MLWLFHDREGFKFCSFRVRTGRFYKGFVYGWFCGIPEAFNFVEAIQSELLLQVTVMC